MYVGTSLNRQPRVELYFDQQTSEYDLHLFLDGETRVIISCPDTETITRLAQEIQESLFRLPSESLYDEYNQSPVIDDMVE